MLNHLIRVFLVTGISMGMLIALPVERIHANNLANQGTGILIDSSPDIDVRYNNISILDGDTTPSVCDGTDFGNIDVTSGSVSHTFILVNTGFAVLNLTNSPNVVVSGPNAADFTVIPQPGGDPFQPGEVRTFGVTFNPSGTGLRTATLSIPNDDPDENPYDFTIQGTGTSLESPPEIDIRFNNISIPHRDSTPSSTDGTDFGFSDITSGSVSRTFALLNTAFATLNLTNSPSVVICSPNPTDFTVTSQPGNPLYPTGVTLFEVTFNPSKSGLQTATVSIANDDPDENPYEFKIQGNGYSIETSPEIDIRAGYAPWTPEGYSVPDGDTTPSYVDHTDFGSTDVTNGSVSNTFLLINTGPVPLNLTGLPSVVISGPNAADFTVTSQPDNPLQQGQVTSFEVTFNPSATGLRTATLTIANDDPDESPYDFAIQGTGTSGSPEIDIKGGYTPYTPDGFSILNGDIIPSSTDGTDFGFSNVTSGSNTRIFTISNYGIIPLNLMNSPKVIIYGSNAADFTVTSQPGSNPIYPGGVTSFGVTFNPTDTGLRTADLIIINDDPNESVYRFTIQGTGTQTSTFISQAAYDGWILESSETSGSGGTKNNKSTTLYIGDDAANKQYISILSFNTNGIPAGTNITRVTLMVKRSGVVGGGNPIKTFKGILVDIKKGNFGTATLALGDFKAAASKTYGPFNPALSSGWYSLDLTSGQTYINRTGNTQIRLRFKLDDNNNSVANYLKLYSGNAPAASRPQLIVEYYLP